MAARRCSVRHYSDAPVSREALGRCLEAARLAPSACNSQPWRFVVVEDSAQRRALAAAASGGVLPLNHFVHQAPVLMAVVLLPPKLSARLGAAVKQKPFAMMDVAIAAEHFCLQAAEEGLGTCMLGWFNEDRVRRLLGIPRPARPVLLLTVGVPASASPPRQRKPLAAVGTWNRYDGEAFA